MLPQPKEFFLPFLKKNQIGKNIYSLFFDRRGTDFDFLPGQYVRMVLPHDNPDNRGTSRFFTIASSPLEKNHIMITTKLMQSSYKKKLLSLKAGTKVKFYGPMGRLFLSEKEKTPLVFLSGGMGITPFHSMIIYAAAKNLKTHITLLASFSKKEEAIFYEELTWIMKIRANIDVVYFFSERITESMIRKYVVAIAKPKYYIVGPPNMVESTRELLDSMGIDEEKLITENFTGY